MKKPVILRQQIKAPQSLPAPPNSAELPVQASERLSGNITLHGLELDMRSLCGGVLVSGSTGSGKTVSAVNPLSAALATNSPKSESKAAVFYLNIKGRGHLDFVNRLPPSRQKDVIYLHAGNFPQCFPSIFNRHRWENDQTAFEAAAHFLEEWVVHVHDNQNRAHDPFWERQRSEIIHVLASLKMREGVLPGTFPLQSKDIPVNFFSLLEKLVLSNDEDALTALVARIRLFLNLIHRRKRKIDEPKTNADYRENEFVAKVLKNVGIDNGEKLGESIHHLRGDQSDETDESGSTSLFKRISKAFLEESEARSIFAKQPQRSTLGDLFFEQLDAESRAKFMALVESKTELADNTWSCVQSDLNSVLSYYSNIDPRTEYKFSRKANRLSIEDIIDQGKILVVDMPLTDSGNATRSKLLFVKLGIMNRILGRYSALREDKKRVNQVRPIVLVIDEFHTLVSKGNSDGEDLFLSRCREFGCISILATQNLNLLAGVIGQGHRFLGLLGNLKTRIFGKNEDGLTNEFAEKVFGIRQNKVLSRAALPYRPEVFGHRLIVARSEEPRPAVPRNVFFMLQTGQFFVSSQEKNVFLDARAELDKPLIKEV